MSFDQHIREHARLILLKEMAAQANFSLMDDLAQPLLDSFGISKSRDWIRNEYRWLMDEVCAVTLMQAGTSVIARITPRGLDHVAGRVILEGVKRPSPKE